MVINQLLSIGGHSAGAVRRCLLASLWTVGCVGGALANSGAVFVATNSDAGNAIIMYNRASDGTLTPTPGSPFPAGGVGSGVSEVLLPNDPLGAQGSLAVSSDNRFLFAVDAGSRQVSAFAIAKTGLTLAGTVDSGGPYPVSLTTRAGVLYVLNAAGAPNFTGFVINQNSGRLTPLKGGQCSLLGPLTNWPTDGSETFGMPGQIGFTPDGANLIVVRKEGPTKADLLSLLTGKSSAALDQGSGRIDVYPLTTKGAPVDCNHPVSYVYPKNSAGGHFPFSFTFSANGGLLVVEISGAPSAKPPLASSAMSSFQIGVGGALTVKSASVPNGQTAICWVARSGNFVYAPDQASDALTTYRVQSDGTLAPSPSSISIGAGSGPSDLKITADGAYLYQLAAGNAGAQVAPRIQPFAINATTGALTPLTAVAIPGLPWAGQAGLALAEF